MPNLNIVEILSHGKIEEIKKLENESNVDLKNFRGEFGENVLHFAVENPDIRVLKYFLNNRYLDNVDEPSKNGSTPLLMAAYYGNLEAIRLLVEYGADCLKRGPLGQGIMDLLRNREHKCIIPEVKKILSTPVLLIDTSSEEGKNSSLRHRKFPWNFFDNSSTNLVSDSKKVKSSPLLTPTKKSSTE